MRVLLWPAVAQRGPKPKDLFSLRARKFIARGHPMPEPRRKGDAQNKDKPLQQDMPTLCHIRDHEVKPHK